MTLIHVTNLFELQLWAHIQELQHFVSIAAAHDTVIVFGCMKDHMRSPLAAFHASTNIVAQVEGTELGHFRTGSK